LRIFLIDSLLRNVQRKAPHWTPLGLAYVAAELERGGHEVVIFERDVLARKRSLSPQDINRAMSDRVAAFSPKLVGFTATTQTIPDVRRAALMVREAWPDARIVLGGHHATALPELTLELCPELDLVVRGEGELAMLDLAEGTPPDQIPDIAYRGPSGDPILTSPRKNHLHLDRIPFPARHLLDMEFYTRPSASPIRNVTLRSTTLMTSRGCNRACAFCVEPLPSGRKMRFHSVNRVLAEIEHILSRYPVEALYFADENLLVDRSRADELCHEMIRSGISQRVQWAAQARADTVDEELLHLLREAGCLQLEYGFESGSQKILDSVNKGATVEANLTAARLTESAGIRYTANIMVGFPQETEGDIDETKRFLKSIKPSHILLSKLNVYPGSRIFQELVADGRMEVDYWIDEDRYDTVNRANFTQIPDDRFKQLVRRIREDVVLPVNGSDYLYNMKPGELLRSVRAYHLPGRVLRDPKTAGRVILRAGKALARRAFQSTDSRPGR
jgi:radical SAM superfamily enzyme YgiQ (UPF0313 family)